MVAGDITTFTDHAGREKVAIIVEVLEDGRYSIFCPRPSHLAVSASAMRGEPNTLFDPTLPQADEAHADEPPVGGDGAGEVTGAVPGSEDGRE